VSKCVTCLVCQIVWLVRCVKWFGVKVLGLLGVSKSLACLVCLVSRCLTCLGCQSVWRVWCQGV
jgi:hypothetical protein